MDDAWRSLEDLGLPDGAVRPSPAGRFDAARARDAVRQVAASVDPARVAPLLAYLRAWRHHWRSHFDRTFDAGEADALLQRLEARLDDPNRYLKLRCIAVANLSRVL